jgi:NADH-quinone oxidoreductase subunit C
MDVDNSAVITLRGKFSGSVLEVAQFRNEVSVTVRKEDISGICSFLKESLGYNFLVDVTAVDYMVRKPRYMIVYHLYSHPKKERLRIKVPVCESDPAIDSMCRIWKSANWLEREVFDLFGITFNNHPDLRRILMPTDWVGHPLRKDYPVQGPDREPYKGRLS